jgi:hypothetical protein
MTALDKVSQRRPLVIFHSGPGSELVFSTKTTLNAIHR